MADKFSITITAKARHGKLWELRNKFGTQLALAKYLGIKQQELGLWVNLKAAPKRISQEKRDRLDAKLAPYGLLLEDLFPPELTDDILDKPKEFEVTRDISLKLLGEAGGIRLLNSPDKEVELSEQQQLIKNLLSSLTPREEKVLILRFGLDNKGEHTIDSIAAEFKCTRTRIAQIEAKAIRKLRHPSRSNKLKEFKEGSNIVYNYLYGSVIYDMEESVVFKLKSEKLCRIFRLGIYSTREIFNVFEKSKTHIRVWVRNELRLKRLMDIERVVVGHRYSNERYEVTFVPMIKLQNGDKVRIRIGPIYPNDLTLIPKHSIAVQVDCQAVEYKL